MVLKTYKGSNTIRDVDKGIVIVMVNFGNETEHRYGVARSTEVPRKM